MRIIGSFLAATLFVLVGAIACFIWLERNESMVNRRQALELMLESKQYEELESRLHWHLRLHPKDNEVRRLQGKYFETLERHDQAFQAYEPVEYGSYYKPETLLRQGEIALRKHNHAEVAVEKLERCVQHELSGPAIRYYGFLLLSEIYDLQGRELAARQTIRLALQFAPKEERARTMRLGLYMELGRRAPEDRVKRLIDFVKADPNDIDSKAGLVMAYLEMERFTDAEPLLQELLGKAPDNPRVLRSRLQYLFMTGKNSELGELLDKNLGEYESDQTVWRLRALMAKEQGNSEKEDAALQKAIELNPRNHELYNMLASAYLRQGKQAEAKRAEQTAKDLRDAKATVQSAVEKVLYGGKDELDLSKVDSAFEKAALPGQLDLVREVLKSNDSTPLDVPRPDVNAKPEPTMIPKNLDNNDRKQI